MSRLGYVIFGLIVVLLAGYLFWPADEDADPDQIRVWTEEPLDSYTLITSELRQEVAGERVLVQGVDRPLAPAGHAKLWRAIRSLRSAYVQEGRESLGLGSAIFELRDGSGRPLLSWKPAGQADAEGQWQLLDHRHARLFVFPAARLRSLFDACGRLDQPGVLAGQGPWRAVGLGRQTLLVDPKQRRWSDALAPQRPAFTKRMRLWLEFWQHLDIEDWTGTAPPALQASSQAALSGSFTPAEPEHAQAIAWRVDEIPVRPLSQETQAWLRVGSLPPQRLDADVWSVMRELAARFERDELFNISVVGAFSAINEITVYRGSEEAFRVQRDGQRDADGLASAWSLLWQHRRVPADHRSGFDALADFAEIVITEPQQRPEPLREPRREDDGAHTVVLSGDQYPHPFWIRIDGDRIESPFHTGVIVHISDFLRDPRPAATLSPVLLGKSVPRIGKLQRARYPDTEGEPIIAELFTAPDGDAWRRQVMTVAGEERESGPSERVDALNMEALLRGVAGVRGSAVRFASEADKLAKAERSVTVRIEPVPADEADETERFEDTVSQDYAWYLHRRGASWVAVDQDGLLAYDLPPGTVTRLWRDVREQLVMPIVPSQVTRLRFVPMTEGGPGFRLTRGRDGWQVQLVSLTAGAAATWRADAGEVQRYLLWLGGLQPERSDPEAVPLTASDAGVRGQVVCSLPINSQRNEEVALTIGAGRICSVTSSRSLQQALPGRVVLTAEDGARLWRGWRSFVHPDELPKLPPADETDAQR